MGDLFNATTAISSYSYGNTSIANDTSKDKSELSEMLVANKLWMCLGVVIVCSGCVGHLLSVSILARSKQMRSMSSTVYLIALSLTGLTTIFTGCLRYTIVVGFAGKDMRNDSQFACKFHMTLTYLSLQYFAWLQATIAVDRMLSVVLLQQYKRYCTWKAALLVTIIELILATLLNLAVTTSISISDKGLCEPHRKDFFYNIWGYIDLVSFSLVPACCMIICNSIVLSVLQKHQNSTGMKQVNPKSITVMLMSLNFVFIITTLPISIVFFVPWGDRGEASYSRVYLCWTIFSLLQYAGTAWTFLIYCVTGSRFRSELHKMRCGYTRVGVVDATAAFQLTQRSQQHHS